MRSPWHPGTDAAEILIRRWGEPDEVVTCPGADCYRLQLERFAGVCAGEVEPLRPIDDAVGNMAVIDALFEAARSGRVVEVSR